MALCRSAGVRSGVGAGGFPGTIAERQFAHPGNLGVTQDPDDLLFGKPLLHR
jgi:hypothetical protein